MATYVEETLYLDVRRRSAGEIINTVVALLDRQQRGWRVKQIAVTIEKPVAVGRGAAHRAIPTPRD
jgi:hypothetical protein